MCVCKALIFHPPTRSSQDHVIGLVMPDLTRWGIKPHILPLKRRLFFH